MTTGKPKAAKQAKKKTPAKAGGKGGAAKRRVSSGITEGITAPEPVRRYRRTQREYAEQYGVSLPTIKRWWKAGHPLDNPDAMGEFLSPRGRKTEDDWDTSPSIRPPTDDAAIPADVPVALDETFFAGEGVLAAIDRLKKAERERAAAYFAEIIRNGHPQILKNRFSEWTGIIEALRKLEKDAPDIRKANELTIDRAEMEAAIGAVFSAFRAAARNLPHRASAKLMAARSREEYLEILTEEVEVMLRSLTEIAVDAASTGAEPVEAVEATAPKKPARARRKKGATK